MTLRRWWMQPWLAGVVGLLVVSVLVRQPSTIALFAYLAAVFGATLVLAFHTATRPLWTRGAWWALTASAVAFFAASISVGAAAVSQGTVQPPGILGVAVYAGLLVAVGLFVRAIRRTREATTVVDSLIVMTAGGIALVVFAIEPLVDSPGPSHLDAVTIGLYLVLDLLLISLVARLWLAPPDVMNRGVRLVRLALLMALVAGVFQHVGYARGMMPDDHPGATVAVRTLMLAAGILMALASSDPQATNAPVDVDVDSAHSRVRVLALLALAVAAPGLAVLSTAGANGEGQTAIILCLMVLLGILMAFRIGRLVDGYARSLRREKALRMVGRDLTGAQDEAQIAQRVAGYAAAVLTEPPLTAVIVSSGPERGGGPAAVDDPSSEGAVGSNWKPGSTILLDVPSAQSRWLELTTRETPDRSDLSALTSLCQSLGMTYDRLDLARELIDQRSQDQVATLLAHSSDIIVLLDETAAVVYASPRAESLHVDATSGTQWPEWFSEPQRARDLLDSSRGEGTGRGDLEFARDQQLQRFDVVVNWLPRERRYVVTQHDVTDRHRLQEELRHQALHDPLTGLANRTVFRDQLARAMARDERSAGRLAVMMVDIDGFKGVNDSFGHAVGDDLLREVAVRLSACLRAGDLAARLGGDEFAVITEGVWSTEDAAVVARRIIGEVGAPARPAGTEVIIGVSVGVALRDPSDLDVDSLQRKADLALYRAKATGKGHYEVFQESMQTDATHRLLQIAELREALASGQIGAEYQPIVNLATGALVGFEALARWHHPSRGLLPPAEFIELAEETGLITGIGQAVTTAALGDMARWQQQFPEHAQARIAVNLSGNQLGDDAVVVHMRDTLHRTGLAPSSVMVEITESVIFPGEGVSATRLEALADLGVSLYIDDFGTGWSSLSRLRTLPVRGIKLAREFVTGLPDEQEVAFARAVRDLSVTLGLEAVVAEGIEREVQRAALQSLGYRLGQGFLTGRPMPAERVTSLLAGASGQNWSEAATSAAA